MKIFIVDSKGVHIPIENISGSTLVKDLKQQIIKIRNVTILPISLAANNEILEDDNTLDYYDITEGRFIIYYGEFQAGLNK